MPSDRIVVKRKLEKILKSVHGLSHKIPEETEKNNLKPLSG
jgi:hypothetical protein